MELGGFLYKTSLKVVFADVKIEAFPHSPKCTDAKSDDLESHAPFGSILKAKRNLEIVSERAMFEASPGRVGGAVGMGGG